MINQYILSNKRVQASSSDVFSHSFLDLHSSSRSPSWNIEKNMDKWPRSVRVRFWSRTHPIIFWSFTNTLLSDLAPSTVSQSFPFLSSTSTGDALPMEEVSGRRAAAWTSDTDDGRGSPLTFMPVSSTTHQRHKERQEFLEFPMIFLIVAGVMIILTTAAVYSYAALMQ